MQKEKTYPIVSSSLRRLPSPNSLSGGFCRFRAAFPIELAEGPKGGRGMGELAERALPRKQSEGQLERAGPQTRVPLPALPR